MTNTISALRHWEQDRNAGVQFGSYSPLPLDSSHPSGNFQSQDDVRYMYQQPQQADAAQFSGIFLTPAPDGDLWSFQMSMPHINNFNDRYSSVQQMRSPAPSLQSGWLASYAGGSRTPTDSLLDDPSIVQYASRKVMRHD